MYGNNFITFLALSQTRKRGQGKVHCDEGIMRYHKYISKTLITYLLTGLFFALSLGGYIYLAELNRRIERAYNTMVQAKTRTKLIETEIEMMKREISFINGIINREKPEVAIYNKIDGLEKMGLNISYGNINKKGPTVFMPLNIALKTQNMQEAMKNLKDITYERFPLLLVDSISFSPDRARTMVEVKIKARLVAIGLNQKT